MKSIIFLLFISVMTIPGKANIHDGGSDIMDAFDTFFKTSVDQDGLVNYKALHMDKSLLVDLIDRIDKERLDGKTDNYKKAFLINSYNVLVIYQLVNNKDANSPLAVNGFFDRQKFSVAGSKLTLNELEKEKIIKQFNDPRVHFVLVCGAKGCPPLLNEAYQPSSLDKTIEARTRKALNSSFIRINKKSVGLSKIFEWYEKDFSKNGNKGIIDYINQYRDTPIVKESKIVYYDYDWTINSQS